MSRQLQATLKRLRELRQLEAMSEDRAPQPWVFLSPEGQRWDERNLRRGWYRCLEAAGIRQVRFHDLRYTFVSLLIRQGAHPKYIQEQGRPSQHPSYDGYLWAFVSEPESRMGE